MILSENELLKIIEENKRLKFENESLRDQISLMLRARFGKKSEHVSNEQLELFNEGELESTLPDPADEDEEIEVPGHTRRRGKRLKLPDRLPREEVILDIDHKHCLDDGTELKFIGEDISEKLEIIPAKVFVKKIIRKKYACPHCEAMSVAKAPETLLPKTNASASLLAYIATCKYVDGLPLHRQEAMFNRAGIDLTRQTMGRWMVAVGEKVESLIELMKEELLRSQYLQMDETTVQVLNEDGKKAETKSYMWVQYAPTATPLVLFTYAASRSAEHPKLLLKDFCGCLQVDGYDGYAPVCRENNITRLGCWAHARRKFFEAFQSSSGKSVGKEGLKYFKKIYEVEEKIKKLPIKDRFYERLTKSVPQLLAMKKWMDAEVAKVTPSSLAGKAIQYALNEWEYLMNCFSHGDFEIDNNGIERKIRPFTIGRKNWLFSATVAGAKASANIYSLVETAKLNQREPHAYLTELFEKLPLAKTREDLLALMPNRLGTVG
jgi:transposase